MSEWRENIERVRDALNTAHPISGDDHDAVDVSDAALTALTAQIEEIQRDWAYSALAATALTAQIEELERRVARVEELEARLREIRVACDPVVHGGSFNENGARKRLTDIEALARAALAQSDPPEDSE